MTALDRFIERLNHKPILWTVGLGLIVYFCAFWLAVFAMFPSLPLVFEVGFLLAGTLVMGYHWTMSRYITASNMAQIIQIAFGIGLVSFAMLLVGAAMHEKAYEWVNQMIYQ